MPRYGHAIQLLITSIFYKLELKFTTSNNQFNLKSVSEIWSVLGFKFCEFRHELDATHFTRGQGGKFGAVRVPKVDPASPCNEHLA